MLRKGNEIVSQDSLRAQEEINTHGQEKSAPIQKKMKYTYIFLLLALNQLIQAQSVSVNFDNCLVSDGGDMSNLMVNGSTTCDCGITNDWEG